MYYRSGVYFTITLTYVFSMVFMAGFFKCVSNGLGSELEKEEAASYRQPVELAARGSRGRSCDQKLSPESRSGGRGAASQLQSPPLRRQGVALSYGQGFPSPWQTRCLAGTSRPSCAQNCSFIHLFLKNNKHKPACRPDACLLLPSVAGVSGCTNLSGAGG